MPQQMQAISLIESAMCKMRSLGFIELFVQHGKVMVGGLVFWIAKGIF
jgi:hypothetical protein